MGAVLVTINARLRVRNLYARPLAAHSVMTVRWAFTVRTWALSGHSSGLFRVLGAGGSAGACMGQDGCCLRLMGSRTQLSTCST